MSDIILLYTRDELRRGALVKEVSGILGAVTLSVDDAEQLSKASQRYPVAALILDIHAHDPDARKIFRLMQQIPSFSNVPVAFIGDTGEISELAAREREEWFSPQRSAREVVEFLGRALSERDPDTGPGPTTRELLRAEADASETTMRVRRVREDARTTFDSVLNRIEAVLETSPPGSQSLALELEQCSNILRVFGLDDASSNLMMASEASEAGVPGALEDAVVALRSISETLQPASDTIRVGVVGGTRGWARALRVQLNPPNELKHFDDAVALFRDHLFTPEAIVVIDESDSATSETLQALRYRRSFWPPAIFVVLSESSPSAPSFADDFDAHEFFAKSTSHFEIAEHLSEVIIARRHQRPSILIIDEEEHRSARLSNLLEEMGIRAVISNSPSDAIRLNRLTPADGVIIREQHNSIAGIDLCRAVIRDSPYRKTPVLVMTPRQPEITRELYFESGAEDVVPENIGASEFKAKLLAMVERIHSRRVFAEVDDVTGITHSCIFPEDLSRHLRRAAPLRATSIFTFDINEFETIRLRYGKVTSRTVLRTVADSLQHLLPAATIYRGWSSSFFGLSEVPFSSEQHLDSLRAGLKGLQRMTFRSADGRGFYVTIGAAHLLIPPLCEDAAHALAALDRVQERSRSRNGLVSARLDTHAQESVAYDDGFAETSRVRWRPVVLTRKDD